jgi:hypothetical protein
MDLMRSIAKQGFVWIPSMGQPVTSMAIPQLFLGIPEESEILFV